VLGQARIVPLFGMLREVFAAVFGEMRGGQKQRRFTGKNGNCFGPKSAWNRSSPKSCAGPVKKGLLALPDGSIAIQTVSSLARKKSRGLMGNQASANGWEYQPAGGSRKDWETLSSDGCVSNRDYSHSTPGHLQRPASNSNSTFVHVNRPVGGMPVHRLPLARTTVIGGTNVTLQKEAGSRHNRYTRNGLPKFPRAGWPPTTRG